MKVASKPDNEVARLERLRSYAILDTEREESFDRITRIIAESLGVSISLVSLVDEGRQWFKSRYGLDAEETPRDLAFCAHAILGEELFIVENTLDDERFHDNPLVTSDPSIRFYAGAPLITPDGFRLGTLCAIDRTTKKISEDHKQLLKDLASLVVDEMELRKSRREVEEANAELEAKIAELTDTQERLEEHARHLAEMAESEVALREELSREVATKDQFFSIIAHDLRSPFTTLLGMSEAMVKMGDNLGQDKMIELAAGVHRSGKKVFELVENLLEWARVQMDNVNFSPAAVSVTELIDDSFEVLRGAAKEKQVELITSVQPATVIADSNMALLVIRNLVANAIKFTPTGGRIDVSAKEADGMLEITVADSGIGVSPDLIDGLFKIDRKTTTPGTNGEPGTGLGLPLCKEMIELNGGTIRVESAPGEGSRFIFTLPAA
ncbi:MAG: GAF domain-containing sensor histidine kinase [Rhodospirillales bacterium]